ncbi:hypothetical protein AS188_12380 [Kocuria flava]|uniref:Sortase n=1 Tax=Kocuria flava TaxID=446860 RepID=A0A0U2WVN4_9MICC|nr:class F sortase [Kocuria flava]ALU40420.1 hypothetical protein AS188_12380 [Kocuria flava]MCJ8505834.1 class F sortase [Kocuria flava]GEO92727.1 hypothetical protein KFL01_20330 [Kocuria flava]
MSTSTRPAPGTTTAPRRAPDRLARWAAAVTVCAAVLWVALMNQWWIAQHVLGHVPQAAPPVRLSIDEVGFDTDVLPYSPSEEELAEDALVPPQTYSGYFLTRYGMPGEGSANTTYVAGHSWDRIQLPFNRLSDPSLVGMRLEVETLDGTLDYVVDSVATYDKDELAGSQIWRIVPNRVVLISCYTRDAVEKNVVVVASPAGA